MFQSKSTQNNEIVGKVINFLKEKPYFYDERNPLFYDAFRKNTEKNHLARLFDPPLSVAVISAKIRYIVSKVIDNYELIKNEKKIKWIYFDKAKFMLPALLARQSKSCKLYEIEALTSNRSHIGLYNYEYKSDKKRPTEENDQEGCRLLLKRISKKTENLEESFCKICNFFCPSHLFLLHFELRYHQRGETYWKKQRNVEIIQCPSCDLVYKTWFEFLKHIKKHQLCYEDINYKTFKIESRKLCIDMNSDLPTKDESSAQLFHKIKHLSQKELLYT